MKQPLSDRELERLLAELPRETASAGFSRRVLGELDAPPRRAAVRGWLVAATAATLALAVAAGLLLWPKPAPEPPTAATVALEEEHRQLMAELEALKASLRASEPPPLLYLGGNESVDLVLDLRPVWRGETGAAVRPAAYDAGRRPVAAADRDGGERR